MTWIESLPMIDQLRELGAYRGFNAREDLKPSCGVLVFAAHNNDAQQAHYLNYGKLGQGPLYSFYVPYHLTIFEGSPICGQGGAVPRFCYFTPGCPGRRRGDYSQN